jgi:outer membrane protein TolC
MHQTKRPPDPSLAPADTSTEAPTAKDALPDQAATPAAGPLKLTVGQAMLLCLENNRALAVQRLNPGIRQTFEEEARARFDPNLEAEISTGRQQGENLARSGSQTENFVLDTVQGAISLSQYFPTGTQVTLEAVSQMEDSSLYADSFYGSRLGLSLNQSLLRGLGPEVNWVELRQARLDTALSEYELRGYTEALVADLESAYWEYAQARRQIEIVEESLKVARQQLDETKGLIDVGRLARAELAAVQAEVAAQEQALIEARAAAETRRLQLLRLLNPAGPAPWQREVTLVHQPTLPDIPLEAVELHVAVAMRLRPLLNQARLEVQSGDLELVKTKNGLLPLMDLFVTLGKSGYADAFGHSINAIDGDSYDALAGVRFQFPIFNREAKARHRRALLARKQSQGVLADLSQLVELDVRTAHIQVDRTHQQISASSATRTYNEEKLRIETERLRVGNSTSFQVAQAQRDLLASRIAEVRALVNYIQALTELYRQDGSLLERRGIAAPGREPASQSAH